MQSYPNDSSRFFFPMFILCEDSVEDSKGKDCYGYASWQLCTRIVFQSFTTVVLKNESVTRFIWSSAGFFVIFWFSDSWNSSSPCAMAAYSIARTLLAPCRGGLSSSVIRTATFPCHYRRCSASMATDASAGSQVDPSTVVPVEEARRFMVDCMVSVGTPKAASVSLADTLVAADVRGHFSHGLNRLGELTSSEPLRRSWETSKTT